MDRLLLLHTRLKYDNLYEGSIVIQAGVLFLGFGNNKK